MVSGRFDRPFSRMFDRMFDRLFSRMFNGIFDRMFDRMFAEYEVRGATMVSGSFGFREYSIG